MTGLSGIYQIRNLVTGSRLSEEHKRNIGLSGKGRKHTEETKKKISETKQRKKAMALLLSAETQA